MWLGSLISRRIMATSRGEITFVFNNLAQKMSDICPFCICQIVMFNPRVMVTELSKNGSSFCIFCWWKQKISHIMGKCLRAHERSYRVLSENGMVNRLWSYHLWDIKDKLVKKPVESAKKIWKP